MTQSPFYIRPATMADTKDAAKIFLHAFNKFNASVGLPPEWPNLDFCEAIVGSLISNPGFYAVVAVDLNGKIIGSNFLEQHDDITAPGPISVDDTIQNKGVGRALMQDTIDHSHRLGKKEIRLVQVSNNTKSFSLYCTMGFDPRETMTAVVGHVAASAATAQLGWVVREMEEKDVEACDALFKETNQFSRRNDIAGSLHPMAPHQPFVLTNSTGKILGYTTGFMLLGHSICESEEVFRALLTGASKKMQEASSVAPPPMVHLTARLYPEILRWCLSEAKMKVLRQEVMMTMGRYYEPKTNVYCPGMAY